MRPSTEFFPRFIAHRIGATAYQTLSSTGQQGKVLAVVSGCIYLVDPSGQLIWLVKEFLPLHTRAIQLAGEWPGLLRDIPFQIRGAELAFHTGVVVDAARAEVWRPAEVGAGGWLPLGEICEKSRILYSQLVKIPRTGFGGLIEPLLGLTGQGGLSPLPQFSDQVLRVAWPAVQTVSLASACQDLGAILARASDLVGLGNGLTPSGDDFLGGLFFGLQALNRLFPTEVGWDPERVQDTLARITGLTNLISSTILNDLAAGQGPKPLHDLVHLLVTPASPESILVAARALVSIGHSTGWDLLTGLLAGLLWTWSATGQGLPETPGREK
jgi:hypothetical protein